ncbi:MAG: AAA family ATPase [Desulfovibrionaceae bacterium]|nr:AAA family ATPase [Desulfovibrionaceae bacterium]
MLRIIPTGEQNFETLRTNNYFYIDKTKFIKNWWSGGDPVTLITRPRRFGKTLMLDTVKTFFAPEYANRPNLFAELDISQNKELCNLQGKIPVISLSFAEVKYDNYEETITKIKEIIADLYLYFTPMLDFKLFLKRERQQFDEISESMSDVTAHSALRNLAKYLARQYNTKPIILLDEYDSPLHEAWVEKYWEKMVKFVRVLFNSTFKTNQYLQRGLITGITCISKESIFSDMNNLEVVSITKDLYADCFGFTEQEVFAAMDEYGLTNKKEVKEWYDGFIFGTKKEIYNPWSILGYLKNKKIGNYWKHSSSNSLVGELIAFGDETIKDQTEKLLKGESIITKLDEQIVFTELYTKEGAIWSLLMASGYVKPLFFNSETEVYEITFTNIESKHIIEDQISKWFHKANTDKNNFIRSLLNNNLEEMNDWMKNIIKKVFSYFDTVNSSNQYEDEDEDDDKEKPENFYHAFVLGLIIDLKQYEISSNGDSGYGRYDVMLIPKHPSDHGIVIEFKTHRPKKEKDLYETCNNALKQIYEKEYITKLQIRDIDLDRIYVYGFAFKGKKVEIMGGAYNKIDWKSILQTE